LEFLAPFWDNVSNDEKDLIQKMLTRDQKKRIKASELLMSVLLDQMINQQVVCQNIVHVVIKVV
jgi:hypothetical protein